MKSYQESSHPMVTTIDFVKVDSRGLTTVAQSFTISLKASPKKATAFVRKVDEMNNKNRCVLQNADFSGGFKMQVFDDQKSKQNILWDRV